MYKTCRGPKSSKTHNSLCSIQQDCKGVYSTDGGVSTTPRKLKEDPFENNLKQGDDSLDLFFKPSNKLVSKSPEISQLKQFASKIEHLEKDDWIQGYVDYLWKNIPELGALLIINNKGELLEHKTSNEFRKKFGIVWNLKKWSFPKIQNQKIFKNSEIGFKKNICNTGDFKND